MVETPSSNQRNSVFFNTTRMKDTSSLGGTESVGNVGWGDILSGNQSEVDSAINLFDLSGDNKVQSDELQMALDFNQDGVVDEQDYLSAQEEGENDPRASLLKGISRQDFSDISSFLSRLKQQESGGSNE